MDLSGGEKMEISPKKIPRKRGREPTNPEEETVLEGSGFWRLENAGEI